MVVVKIVENDFHSLFATVKISRDKLSSQRSGWVLINTFTSLFLPDKSHSQLYNSSTSFPCPPLPPLLSSFIFFPAHLLPAITISAWTTVAWHFSHFLYAQMALNVEHKTRQRLSDRLHVELSGNMALTVWDWGVWCALRGRFNVF